MNNTDIIKKLEQMDKTIKYLINELKGNKEVTPIQKAVRQITSSKSTRDQVRNALDVLCGTPDVLSSKQTAFCIFFGLLNKGELGEDIDNWINIQIGKHKYNERSSFIQQVVDVIENNYNSKGDFKIRIKNYLNSKKQK